jgi:hypothetical protein
VNLKNSMILSGLEPMTFQLVAHVKNRPMEKCNLAIKFWDLYASNMSQVNSV